MCWMCRMCQKIRKSFYYMAYFACYMAWKAGFARLRFTGDRHNRHTRHRPKRILCNFIYILFYWKDLRKSFALSSGHSFLPQNRETAYSQLVKFLKARKPISEWSKPFLQQAWRLFCTPDKTGAYREYVGVYEYWLKHWMKKWFCAKC